MASRECPVSGSLAKMMFVAFTIGWRNQRTTAPDLWGMRDVVRRPDTPCAPPQLGFGKSRFTNGEPAGWFGDPLSIAHANHSATTRFGNQQAQEMTG